MKKGKEQKETKWLRNADARDKFINQHGMEKFLKNCEIDEKWRNLQDIPIPARFEWLFKHFLNIWQGCEWSFGGSIIFTFQTIKDYQECMHVPFRVYDKKLLMKMKAWACNQIADMKGD